MLTRQATYGKVYEGFTWQIPRRFNIADAICDRHVGANREALVHHNADRTAERYTFEALRDASCRLANALAALGVVRGDRVGILLPQCPQTVIAHLATYRLGAVAVPLFTLFGPEAIEYRLANSAASVIITSNTGLEKLSGTRDRLPELRHIINIEADRSPGVSAFDELIEQASPAHHMVDTAPEDPALIVYTSGTTGKPKGVLHAHRVLLGHLPGVEFPHEFFPQLGDRMWTPADWAWVGGLLDVLLPSLYHGVPVLSYRFPKFDPELALDFMNRYDVRNVFMPPTALKIMRQAFSAKTGACPRIRTIASGGERLGEEMLAWGRSIFGVTINEFYGQTEANLVIGNCAKIMPVKTGSMGRAIPGHIVEVVDNEGIPVSPGEEGTIAVRTPDPVMFLKYWNEPGATRDKFRGEWCMTGDVGVRDEEGYFWFQGRDDDVINSGGYRIGPGEIEECLMRHPAVAMVAVIGVPDEMRGQIVKAFVVPHSGSFPGPALAAEITSFVKTQLSAHEYPRQIEFRETLPMTITGKIRRRDLREATSKRSE